MNTEEHNAAFDRWLREHAGVLHHVANGFAEGADRHDLMQELLLAVWRAVPAFRGGALPSTFVYRVAHNAALTWKRSQRNYQKRVERFGALHRAVIDSPAAAHGGETEMLELLYKHIRELPLVDRSLILLHLEGVSYAEISSLHGLSESNVGVRLNRLKQKLSVTMREVTHELR